jgi:hypothetical protein
VLADADVLYTADARLVCAGCFAKADLAVSNDLARGRIGGLASTAAVIGAIPFFVHVSTTDNGTYRDWVALPCGAIALVCGLVALVPALRGPGKGARLGLAAVAVALGVLQLLRGVGAV